MDIDIKWFSVGCTAVVVGGVFLLGKLAPGEPKSKVLVPGCDLLGRTAIERLPVNNVPPVAVVIWITVSLILGFVIPYVHQLPEQGLSQHSGRWSFFGTAFGILTTLNYTLIVPLLLGCYLWLLSTASSFFKPKQLEKLGLIDTRAAEDEDGDPEPLRKAPAPRLFGRYIYHAALLFISLGIQYGAMCSVEWESGDFCPWVKGADGDETLNWIGALYYSLRGLNTYMALGLFISTAVVWWIITQRLDCEDRKKLLTRTLRVHLPVRYLGTTLLAAAVVSATAVTVHGLLLIALYQQAKPDLIELFTRSTWIVFFLLSLIGCVFVGSSLWCIHRWLVEAVQDIESSEMERLDAESQTTAAGRSDVHAADSRAGTLEQYWQARISLHQEIEAGETWPLPRGGRAAVVFTGLVQMVNIVGAVAALLIGK